MIIMKGLQTMSLLSSTLGVMLLLALLSRAVAKTTTTDHTIIGGTIVPPGRYPYYARFDPPDQDPGPSTKINICGAALVSPYVAVTAAHCVRNTDNSFRGFPKKIVVGATTFKDGDGETIEVYCVTVHPDYNPDPKGPNPEYHDVAVLRLATPSCQKPVELNTDPSYPRPTDKIITMGMGFTDKEVTQPSQELREKEVGPTGNEDCAADPNFSGQLCVGDVGGGSCAGDSGGPLILQLNGDLIGVDSVRGANGTCGEYIIHTRVSQYAEWIQSQIDCVECQHFPNKGYCPSAPSIMAKARQFLTGNIKKVVEYFDPHSENQSLRKR